MFISVQIDKWLSDDPNSPDYWRCQYTLVDSEFGSVSGVGACASAGPGAGVGVSACTSAIIQEYSQRGLNVEGNLLQYLLWLQRKYHWPIHEAIPWYNQAAQDPRFQEFAALWKLVDQDRLKKYMILS